MPVLSNKPGWFHIQSDSLAFIASGKKWEVALLSFTQPIPMQLVYTKNGFIVFPKYRSGIIEGNAELVLTHRNQSFYYALALKNKKAGLIYERDYRSPKTVNPDSSLQQQSIVHRYDQWRNLHQLQSHSGYFTESPIQLPATSGVYRAQELNAVSAYYVQAGSALSIPIKAIYDRKEKAFIVVAGPLKDRHNNLVANGTLVKFEYSDDRHFFLKEATVLNGFATTSIQPENNKKYQLKASIHQTFSNTIELHPQ